MRFVGEPHTRWFEIVACEGVAIDQDALRQFPFEHMAAAEILATGKPLLLTGHNQERFAEHRYSNLSASSSAMPARSYMETLWVSRDRKQTAKRLLNVTSP
ncbi:MAG: hypothetical protein MRJ92_07825 [Nitrospira sp.]|nr:hypothetical protein [Nitrospira sp.]